MLNFLLGCALAYVAIIYGLIPLICLISSVFLIIGGGIARLYYFIEDYLNERTENDK